MFTVKWIVHGNEVAPVESESFYALSADTVVAACRYGLTAMRLKYPETPPNGFVVFDDTGKEIRRWIGPG
jgi:hypothetical protein